MNSQQTTYSAVLGVVLSYIRNEKGLEQGDMAERMGVSQASYSRLEGGKSSFSVDQMYLAAQALEISARELTERLNNTIDSLSSQGVAVIPQMRGNSTQVKKDGSNMGSFLIGAGLAAAAIALLGKK
ncbi:helix-turn-helix domain-containing protein [Aliikangiella sp. IMCC44359]|uniref:helix-turn-helix domain-containing protein n=1 Tax=Aliikangiella sp. IMCC44359 TaxID=3459125 RepID=UPI00403B2BA2